MANVTVDHDRLAVDHADRESLAHFSSVHIGQYDVEHQGFTGQCRFAAERNPLVACALLNDDVREYPQRAISGFGKPVSFVASSISHDAGSATAMPRSWNREIRVVPGSSRYGQRVNSSLNRSDDAGLLAAAIRVVCLQPDFLLGQITSSA